MATNLKNATQPQDTSGMMLVSAPMNTVPPMLNTSADPEFNSLSLAPIPPILGTDVDLARQFYRSSVSQVRMSPLPSLSKISVGAQAQSQVIITQVSQGGGGSSGSSGIMLEVNGAANPIQNVLNITGSAISYGPGKGQVSIAAGNAYQLIQEAGSPLPVEPILNFLAPITATDNVGNTSTDIAVPDMVGDSGSGGVDGLVPAPPAGSFAAGKFLTAGGTWAVPPGTGGAAFYQTIEQAGVSKPQEDNLNFLAPITATDNPGNSSTDIAVSVMVGDSGSGGTKGLAPAPPAGSAAAGKYLAADGTFSVPPGTGGVGIVAIDRTGLSANISPTTLVTPGSAGYYRASGWIVATTGDVSVATLPAIVITATDADSSVSHPFSLINALAANPMPVGSFGIPSASWSGVMYAKSGVAIQYSTTSYSSASSTLRYALHIRLEGPF